MNEKFKIFAENNLAEFEKLEKEGDPVLLAFEKIWDDIGSCCNSCPMKCIGNPDCPVALALVAGLNERFKTMKDPTPWVGVELDGCLSMNVRVDQNWDLTIGAPIPRSLELVKDLLAKDIVVKIFTPRVSGTNPKAVQAARTIRKWTKEHIGTALQSTAEKDMYCVSIFSTSMHQMIPETGDLIETLFSKSVEELKTTRTTLNQIILGLEPDKAIKQ